MGRLQKGVNDLESWCLNNGEFGEKLKSEWTGICEDGNHYEIDEVARASSKKFNWKCSKGHEWYAMVNSRTSSKRGCPYCSGNRVSNENSLKTWCLKYGSFGGQLLSEWTGICEDGEHYKIDQIAKASHKRVKWICSKGHEWFAMVNDRTKYKTGCPHCFNTNRGEIVSKTRLSEKNSLKNWCSSSGLFGKKLMSEWTGLCEDNQQYAIDEVSFGSHKKFKWRCGYGHEWFAKVNSRTSHKSDCHIVLRIVKVR